MTKHLNHSRDDVRIYIFGFAVKIRNVRRRVKEYLRHGAKMLAINEFEEHGGFKLRKAKQMVESVEKKLARRAEKSLNL